MVTKTLTSNSIQSGLDGLDFDASNETWIIDPGVIVSSQTGLGVFNEGHSNVVLINDGKVFSQVAHQGDDGVYFGTFPGTVGGNALVRNNAGAEIFGADIGVLLDIKANIYTGIGSNVVNNFGTIIGDVEGVEFGQHAVSVVLNNHGFIFGQNEAVFDRSGGTINNFATIRSPAYALDLNTAPYLTTSVTNAAGGVIQGLAASIYISDGKLHLVNHGAVIGDIVDTTNLHEVIINPGKIQGAVEFGTGNDIFNGTGGTSGIIYAGGGNDRIIGGNGSVKIHVGSGYDTITAGPGHDQFIFDSLLTGQVERITNFNPSLDKIVLSETEFPGIGAHGTLGAAYFHLGTPVNGHAQIEYTRGNGYLYYDTNGKAGPHVHFATLFETPTTHPTLTHFDFIVV
jgi:Ca2+-binding RTX toxin-like protein